MAVEVTCQAKVSACECAGGGQMTVLHNPYGLKQVVNVMVWGGPAYWSTLEGWKHPHTSTIELLLKVPWGAVIALPDLLLLLLSSPLSPSFCNDLQEVFCQGPLTSWGCPCPIAPVSRLPTCTLELLMLDGLRLLPQGAGQRFLFAPCLYMPRCTRVPYPACQDPAAFLV